MTELYLGKLFFPKVVLVELERQAMIALHTFLEHMCMCKRMCLPLP